MECDSMDVFTWNPPAWAVPIWDQTPPGFDPAIGQPAPTLTPFLAQPASADGLTAAVVVLPGGGYGMKAQHEAEPVARWLNQLGISAFVLDYRVAPYRHPIPLLDARRAVQLVRARAAEWKIDPGRVAVLGFSAGGHLASSCGTHFEQIESGVVDEVSAHSFHPNALVLCYPVISFGPFRHQGSMENLLGENPQATAVEALSNETQVSKQTPPTFLWHSANDEPVPVENSLLFAQACSACAVPFELHVFADAEHGVGLAEEHPSAAPWTGLCARWLASLGFVTQSGS
jgi:acetyl esterase/lipase